MLAFALAAISSQADEVVISDDGEQIRLNGDGTWVRISRDRFAHDEQGRRIRLRPDGTWSVVTQDAQSAPQRNAPNVVAAPVNLTDEPLLLLPEVVIFKRVIKRPKADHAETRMRFRLALTNSDAGEFTVPSDLANQLLVKSSGGTEFEVIESNVSESRLDPGQRAQIEVWVAGSPRWFGTKYLSVHVPPGLLGNGVERILSKNMDEVIRREVAQF